MAALWRTLLRPSVRSLPVVACGTYLTATAPRTQCGWFGKTGAEIAEEDEARRRQEAQAIRAKLGPLASLDLNGDGKVDEKDFFLAVELAKQKAMVDAGGEDAFKYIGDEASKVIATGLPSQLSWGFCSGYCAGFAAKKVGKLVAVFVGGVFCLLQALAYNGYIVVDQAKIEQDFNSFVDLNHDGQLDTKDLKVIYDKLYAVLSYNMPSGSGFAAGLVLGLRSG
eukprot:CAMPEP_0197416202 /NCGR_PEP_ID=MMETSP1170-20131217/2564_1 /TAXON_ID=54406 /ORGANISM="Sarcinochrysis sp, Strain CCMP770" /LENGTH=223 /DNA_ID=CAMNT_0042943085 /DNA_START=24 /DNA_END=695 /DNA_ORIENTATION=+